jgi:E3 ubiquitin-protein ligase FANCL
VSAPRSSSVSSSPPTALPDVAYYNQLMAELDIVGWHRLTHLGDDLRVLELQTQDAGGRTHAVRVTLAPDYPATPPLCAVDAPAEFTLQWSRGDASTGRRRPTLQTLLDQFELFLQEYQTFWNVLDEIDARCCVLEPHHPSRATGRRRLALQRHVSVQVEVSPTHPRGLCDLKFFGSDATVAPLRERWSDHLFEWEDHRSVAQNLELLLDVELPSPATTKTEEFALECGICYCYRLDVRDNADGNPASVEESVIPDRLCENPKCNRPFHEKCLFEWLKALPTARQSFSTVFGECPYCREAISAKVVA